jgi:hypothetical protein
VSEPIPPVAAVLDPVELQSRREMAVAFICDAGYPHTVAQQRQVLEDARHLVTESFRRRGIPSPVGGWVLGLVPPCDTWTDHIAPDIAARVLADLAEHPPTAAVAVVVAPDLSGRPRQAP